MTPIQASKKSNDKVNYSIFQDKSRKLNPKLKLGQLVRTAYIKKVFSKETVQTTAICFIQ